MNVGFNPELKWEDKKSYLKSFTTSFFFGPPQAVGHDSGS
jgi:hypothetical protein